jgi:hypothetical protein
MAYRQLPEQHDFSDADQRYQRQPQRSAAGHMPVSRTRQPVQHLPQQPYPPASPHRAGHYAGIHPEDAPYYTVDVVLDEAEEADEFYSQRPRTSIRTYNQPLPPAQQTRYAIEERPELLPSVRPRRSAQARTTDHPSAVQGAAKRRRLPRFHPLVYLGIGMVGMIVLWFSFDAIATLWTTVHDDWTYGRPRTFQVDAVVGHNDSQANPSHFIAMNLNRQVIIIEIPGGDISKTKIYSGPTLYGQGADLAPVTLSFQDESGNGRPAMLVHFQDSVVIYLNERVGNSWEFVPKH